LLNKEILKGEASLPLTSCLTAFGISCVTTDNLFLQNRLIQNSQTGGQWYSDTSPISIPWLNFSIAHFIIGDVQMRPMPQTFLLGNLSAKAHQGQNSQHFIFIATYEQA